MSAAPFLWMGITVASCTWIMTADHRTRVNLPGDGFHGGTEDVLDLIENRRRPLNHVDEVTGKILDVPNSDSFAKALI